MILRKDIVQRYDWSLPYSNNTYKRISSNNEKIYPYLHLFPVIVLVYVQDRLSPVEFLKGN